MEITVLLQTKGFIEIILAFTGFNLFDYLTKELPVTLIDY